jgi:hypothetical protein
VLLHGAYWVFLSVGVARYALIALVLACAMLAMPFLVETSRRVLAGYALALAIAMLGTVGRIGGPIAEARATAFSASPARVSQERVVAFLQQHEQMQPFGAQWWAPVADLEYLMDDGFNFAPYPAVTPEGQRRGFLLVTNSHFDGTDDKTFWGLVASCGPPALAVPPYSVYQCGVRASSNRTPGALPGTPPQGRP